MGGETKRDSLILERIGQRGDQSHRLEMTHSKGPRGTRDNKVEVPTHRADGGRHVHQTIAKTYTHKTRKCDFRWSGPNATLNPVAIFRGEDNYCKLLSMYLVQVLTRHKRKLDIGLMNQNRAIARLHSSFPSSRHQASKARYLCDYPLCDYN
jgi:hypothetical protein